MKNLIPFLKKHKSMWILPLVFLVLLVVVFAFTSSPGTTERPFEYTVF